MSGKRSKLARQPEFVGKFKQLRIPPHGRRVAAFESPGFLAQVYLDKNGYTRISVNRTSYESAKHDRWRDGITWDQLQEIKAAIGYADWWAVEVYPPDSQVVNVANIRHLFLLRDAPPFAWNSVEKVDEVYIGPPKFTPEQIQDAIRVAVEGPKK